MNKKTPTNGYYKLHLGYEVILDTEGKESKGEELFQWFHFSMNAWYILKENTGKDLTGYMDVLQGTDNDKAVALGDILFAAASAYNMEEEIPINYNIYKVRSWFGSEIGAEEIQGITDALLWNVDTGIKQEAGGK